MEIKRSPVLECIISTVRYLSRNYYLKFKKPILIYFDKRETPRRLKKGRNPLNLVNLNTQIWNPKIPFPTSLHVPTTSTARTYLLLAVVGVLGETEDQGGLADGLIA